MGGDILFTRHDARHGALWLRDAYTMLAAYRMRWVVLLVCYYVVALLAEFVPLIGQVAVALLKPVFAVGFLAAAWNQERGKPPSVADLFQGFRSNLWALLPIGAFLLVGVSLAVFATSVVDDGKLLDILLGRGKLDEAALASGELQGAMLFAAVLALPVVLAIWFAPGLVVFHDCSAGTALAISLRAALANWKPIVVYCMLVFVFGGLLPAVVVAVISALARGISAAFAVAFLLPYALLFVAMLHISDYVGYRDVFHAGEPIGGKDAETAA